MLQGLRPVQETCDRLKNKDIPQLEQTVKALESAHPDLSHAAEEVGRKFNDVTRQIRELHTLKQQAIMITRLHKEADKAKQEVQQLEGCRTNEARN
ncbi:hypothetical protein CPB84DRAFT_808427 [Gymnopilus junonius]|uniref:Uncharacterized protein n=1 Tax=Gymnopilus junonius TaxID=109634 RepID=A0A9P5NSP5_GYMJU|nr:hypothetical protein CPB84DRAFT_808427 [Gymnopilus junonius]